MDNKLSVLIDQQTIKNKCGDISNNTSQQTAVAMEIGRRAASGEDSRATQLHTVYHTLIEATDCGTVSCGVSLL